MQQTEINLEQAELTCWCHIAPFGEFTRIERHGDAETVITQLLDRTAYEQVLAAFKGPEVLVDFEHRAQNTDDTTAGAWVQQLAIRESGLWGLLKFTDVGTAAVRGRRLRFLSPVWHLDDTGRPIALKNVALTNVPYFKNLRPVLNKAPTQNQPGEPTGDPQPKEHTMKDLAAFFGLPEAASEAEIIAAAKAAQEQIKTLQKRIAELENVQLTAEAETVAETNKDRIQNKDRFVKLYVQNKELAMNMLGTLAAPTATTPPVTNTKDAKLPSFAAGTPAAAVQNKYDEWRAMPEGEQKENFLFTHAAAINESAP